MSQQTRQDQAEIAALQQAYKSALLSVDRARAEEVLRTASSLFATPLEVAELCLAPVLEQMGDAWENGHLALSQIYMASRISEDLVERRDITERREFEEELKRSNAELEQFSYAASHDMRQPLRMISSYLQLLEMGLAGQLDNAKRGYFDSAIEGAKRIDQMLVALLEYSRAGRMGEPTTWIDSRAILDEALKFLQPALAEAQAKLPISGEWPRIFASHDEILRLLQNLIGNAIKFRIAGKAPEIAITSETIKNEWRFCVADNGIGIIPEQIKRLFQVFRRLQSHEAYEGNGVGLALCRKIVGTHLGGIGGRKSGQQVLCRVTQQPF